MSCPGNQSSYAPLKASWVKQKKYELYTWTPPLEKYEEKYGAFSIRAAVRPPYNQYANPWFRQQPHFYGIS